ncbi:hypothetical protein LI088_11580 [Adlercreutzia equolifaciens]|uniref:hypothetical protein n=1 Tax=Coriobacteriia TaxID=84998 RepID=UPI00189A7205|nr:MULTISPECIES: hypothetical protein [Coriobacteriia]MCB6761510.1 hypothetical protein [Adlercreutzia equolifaciens]MCB6977250.1 hypothetical protein [Adlercreutzia equolifaciens]MDE8685225.1 hypothetical protein [Adlercreutzia rubneri]
MSGTIHISFPKPGTVLTYADAFKAYRELEGYMLSRVYISSFQGNVGVYDLITHLEDLASKHGVDDGRKLSSLRELMHLFVSERTALANGVNGARFYLHGNAKALAKHDETHLFEIGIDGERLCRELDEFIELLGEESADTDEYADTYSPYPPKRMATRKTNNGFPKWLTVSICALMACFGLSVLAHVIIQFGILSRWLV